MLGSLMCALAAPTLGALCTRPEPAAWVTHAAIRPARLNASLWGPADDQPVELRPARDPGPAFPTTPASLPLDPCDEPALADAPAMVLPAEGPRGFARALAAS